MALEASVVQLWTDFIFVGYDIPNGRRQVSEDGLNWRWERMKEIPTEVSASSIVPDVDSGTVFNRPVDSSHVWDSFNFLCVPERRHEEITAPDRPTRTLWSFREVLTASLVKTKNGMTTFQYAVMDPHCTRLRVENSAKTQLLYLILLEHSKYSIREPEPTQRVKTAVLILPIGANKGFEVISAGDGSKSLSISSCVISGKTARIRTSCFKST